MTEDRDPIIDSLLDEVLCGHQPPDLTQRILGAHQAMAQVPENVPAVGISVTDGSHRRSSSKRGRSGIPAGWTTAAVVLLGAGLFTAWAWQQHQQFQLANQPPPRSVPRSTTQPKAIVQATPQQTYEGQEEETVLPDWANPDELRKQMKDSRAIASSSAPRTPVAAEPDEVETPQFERSAVTGTPPSGAQVVKFINDQLRAGWKKAKVTPTERIHDLPWFNRATRILLGRAPTKQERDAFDQNRDREAAIDHLLAHEDFARHWARQFTQILVGGATSKKFNSIALENYLFEAFIDSKPFDQLAFELITAQGFSDNGTSANPAVNFLLAHHADSEAQVAATDKVCQVFLGKQMQCVRCHDHPANERLAQQTYWGIASFFTQMHAEKTPHGMKLVDRDYAGSKGNTPDEADLFFTNADEFGRAAFPEFPGQNEPVSKSGRIDTVNRRVELAYSIVDSDDFAQAAVNRMWRLVFRTGFTQPVDNMGVHNRSPHAKLLDGLASNFRHSKYDVRAALRWMIRSSAFDRKVRSKNDPLIARSGSDAFSSFARKEVISYEAIEKPLMIAAANTGRDPSLVLGNLGAAANVPKDVVAKERSKINALHRERLLNTRSGSLLNRLARNRSLSNASAVEHLFYAFVSRAPTEIELKSGESILANNARLDGLIEIGQIILNSEEFRTQH